MLSATAVILQYICLVKSQRELEQNPEHFPGNSFHEQWAERGFLHIRKMQRRSRKERAGSWICLVPNCSPPPKKAIFVTDLHVGFDKLVWSNEEKRKCVRSGWQLTKLRWFSCSARALAETLNKSLQVSGDSRYFLWIDLLKMLSVGGWMCTSWKSSAAFHSRGCTSPTSLILHVLHHSE